MVDQMSEKTVEQFKVETATAKRTFSRLVNNITRAYTDKSEEELRDSDRKLTIEAGKVRVANDDVEAGHIAELEVMQDTDEEAVLTNQKKADLEKTAKECELKLKETKGLIQEILWANFGRIEMSIAVHAAEEECEHVDAVQPDISQEVYEFKLNHLKGLATTAKEAYRWWQR
ncbi:unnamed protein product [Ophioblennius macclurei]